MERKFSEFRKSDKSLNHESLLHVSCGSVVNSWSLTQEVVGSNNPFNHKYFCHRINSVKLRNSICFHVYIIAPVREKILTS